MVIEDGAARCGRKGDRYIEEMFNVEFSEIHATAKIGVV